MNYYEKSTNIFKNIFNGSKLHLYFILDQNMIEEWPNDLFPLNSGAYKTASLFELGIKDEYTKAAPFLIEFLHDKDKLYKYIINNLEKNLGIFLISSRKWSSIFAESQALLWPKRENGERIYFRYYDPIIFTILFNYYKNNGLLFPFTSFDTVIWFDSIKNKILSVNNKELGNIVNLDSPWTIDANLEEFLFEETIPYNIIAMLKDSNAYFHEIPTFSLYKQINIFLKEAASYKIFDLNDLFYFCQISFLFPNFVNSEPFTKKINEFSYGNYKNFANFIDSFTKEEVVALNTK